MLDGCTPWDCLPSGFQQKPQYLLLAQAEWELREREQRVGVKSLVCRRKI